MSQLFPYFPSYGGDKTQDSSFQEPDHPFKIPLETSQSPSAVSQALGAKNTIFLTSIRLSLITDLTDLPTRYSDQYC